MEGNGLHPDGSTKIHGTQYESQLSYHSDWNSLMNVVEKISKTIIPKAWLNAGWDLSVFFSIHTVGTSFEIGDNDLYITDCGINPKGWINAGKPPIERTWLAVVEFIKWYNSKNT